MSSIEIVCAVAAAVLVFWIVGAYNRLTRLRGALVQSFAPVDAQLQARQTLLLELLDTLEPLLPHAVDRLHALRSACQQFDAARAHARQRPAEAGAVKSLRMAEQILIDVRARLPAQGVAGVDLNQLNTKLTATEAALAFARAQFNSAVMEYNRAMAQFPTLLIVGLFGLRLGDSF